MSDCSNKENDQEEQPAFKKRRSKKDSPVSSCIRSTCGISISPDLRFHRTGTGHFDVSPQSAMADESPSRQVNLRKRQLGLVVNSPKSSQKKAPNEIEHKARIESLRKNFGQHSLLKAASPQSTANKEAAMVLSSKVADEKDCQVQEKMDAKDESPTKNDGCKKDPSAENQVEGRESTMKQEDSKPEENEEKVGDKVEDTSYKVGKILVGKDGLCTPEVAEKELLSLLPMHYKLGVLLGEGGFGKVFLVKKNGAAESLACKVSMHYGNEREKELFLREGKMQKIFKHENICRSWGVNSGPTMVVIFMELIIGAELFNLIPLGVGIAIDKSFKYFMQMLDAVEYLHQLGFAHFDIKPENIIVTDDGVAKLVDFGYGCMYRYKGEIRPVKGRRGTRPYSAPETLQTELPYEPLPADLFSLGVTLLTIASGERVWKEASRADARYRAWRRKETEKVKALRRLPLDLLNFLQKMLGHRPRERMTIAQIRKHAWFQAGIRGQLQQQPLRTADAKLVAKRHISASQPESSSTATDFEQSSVVCKSVSFSQPADKVMLMTGPCHMVDEKPDTAFNPRCIMRRMTRFFSRFDAKTTMERLMQAISGEIHIEVTHRGPGTLLVEARGQVSFTARVVLICFARSANAAAGADGRSPAPILVEVRRASGDGFALLEFYTSVYRTLTRLKVVDEDHPYLDLLNTPRPDVEPSAAPSDNRFGQETKEKTM